MKTIASPCTSFPRITFQDTNVVGNVYFVNYFRWQFECFGEWLRYAFPQRWRAIRRGDHSARILSCCLNFDDPFGARIGDEIRISGTVKEQLDGSLVMSTDVDKLCEIESFRIASGGMTWAMDDHEGLDSTEEPVGPCYSLSIPVPGGWGLSPIDLLSWQGKCRELFLADHAPEMLKLIANRRIALETVTASLSIVKLPPCPVEEVRIELRLEAIKCGQMDVRFDYYAESERGAYWIAQGTQRMSVREWNGSLLVPCFFSTDLIRALRRLTDSERMLLKIDEILEFVKENKLDTNPLPISNR